MRKKVSVMYVTAHNKTPISTNTNKGKGANPGRHPWLGNLIPAHRKHILEEGGGSPCGRHSVEESRNPWPAYSPPAPLI